MQSRIICKYCNSINVIKGICRSCNRPYITVAEPMVNIQLAAKYKIRVDAPNGAFRYDEVIGYPMIVEGCSNFSLFKRLVNGKWSVSEVTTGMKLGTDYASETDAYAGIRNLIEKTGVTHIQKMIDQYKMPQELPTNVTKETITK